MKELTLKVRPPASLGAVVSNACQPFALQVTALPQAELPGVLGARAEARRYG